MPLFCHHCSPMDKVQMIICSSSNTFKMGERISFFFFPIMRSYVVTTSKNTKRLCVSYVIGSFAVERQWVELVGNVM